MAGKLKIIIFVALGLISFGASYFAFGFLRPAPEVAMAGAGASQLEGEAGQPGAQVPGTTAMGESTQPEIFTQSVSISMKERELDDLIRELNYKIDAHNTKDQEFTKREKQIQLAAENLKKQAREIEAIRTRLIAPDGPIAMAQQAKTRLEQTRVRIDRDEQVNVQKLAEQYDKMEATSAGEMLITMCKERKNDVVKILYFMATKKSAQVLSDMSDKTLAAELCGLLLEVQQQDTQNEG